MFVFVRCEDVGENLGQLLGHVRGDPVGCVEVPDRFCQLRRTRDRRLGHALAADLHEWPVERGSAAAIL